MFSSVPCVLSDQGLAKESACSLILPAESPPRTGPSALASLHPLPLVSTAENGWKIHLILGLRKQALITLT